MNIEPRGKLVVTRHKALVLYLIEEGYVPVDVEVCNYVREDDVRDRDVYGILPFYLAALASSLTFVDIRPGKEFKNVELTLDDVYRCVKGVYIYTVREVDDE